MIEGVSEMTTASEADLKKSYTAEERDAMLEAAADACGIGDYDEADKIIRQMPIHPRWAKIIADVAGKDFLLKHYNITHANEVYGEGWLNDECGKTCGSFGMGCRPSHRL